VNTVSKLVTKEQKERSEYSIKVSYKRTKERKEKKKKRKKEKNL